ncbi:MAG: hypothetical protein ABIX46_09225 [Burkholderiaceae bacterium]
MLRALVALLVLVNLGIYAWGRGWLGDAAREPGAEGAARQARQIRPQSVVILSPTSARAAAAGLACLEAGPFSASQLGAAETVLQPLLPAGSWTDVRTERPAVWTVYMGKYETPELMARKQAEVGRTRIEFEEVRGTPDLEPGLALGRFDSREAADRALAQYVLRGLRSARVTELVPATTSHMLRIEKAGSAVLAQATALRNEALGNGFTSCATAESPR